MPNLNEQIRLNMYQCVSALILTLLLPTNFLVKCCGLIKASKKPSACLNKTLTEENINNYNQSVIVIVCI